MTALEITYEDGLRLSELTGRLDQLEYMQDHILACYSAELLIIAIVVVMVWCCINWFVLMGTDWGKSKIPHLYERTDELPERTRFLRPAWSCDDVCTREAIWVTTTTYKCVFIVGLILMVAIAILVSYICRDIVLQADIVGVQGQIDAIMAKYGGGA